MQLSFDPDKNERNTLERGLDFTLAADLDWATALIDENPAVTMVSGATGY
jgi:uncharacterized DUF497 family protein